MLDHHRLTACIAVMLACIMLGEKALAAPVTYRFTTSGVGLETRNFMAATPDQRLYTDSTVISGEFVYDGSGAAIEGFPGVYAALPSLQGSANGDLFSYTLGIAVVQDNAPVPANCGDPPAPACQGIQDRVILTNTLRAGDFSGYVKIDGQSTQFELTNVAVFWVDADGTAIDDLALPATLPPGPFCPDTQPTCGQIRLDFAEVGNPDNIHAVFGAGFNLTVVPVPGAAWLFGSALGLLVRFRSRGGSA